MAEEREAGQGEQGFTVSDKRLFTSDGKRRPDVDIESRTEASSAPPAERSPEPPPASEPSPQVEPSSQAGPATPKLPLGGPSAGEMPTADFSTFVAMLANNIMMFLGQIPEPVSQQRHLDLGQAKHTIDVLIMLQDKTQGNLTTEEAQLLDDVLQQLQMAFVSVSRQVESTP